MPGKSHRKGKGKNRQSFQAKAVRQSAVTQPVEPVARPALTATLTQSKPAIARYSYIAAELKKISILSVIMLVIIVVLSFVL